MFGTNGFNFFVCGTYLLSWRHSISWHPCQLLYEVFRYLSYSAKHLKTWCTRECRGCFRLPLEILVMARWFYFPPEPVGVWESFAKRVKPNSRDLSRFVLFSHHICNLNIFTVSPPSFREWCSNSPPPLWIRCLRSYSSPVVYIY